MEIASAGHNGAMQETVLLILGVCDNACREEVISILESVPGVTEVYMSLYRGLAIVRHASTCTAEGLVGPLVANGYGASITKLRVSVGMLKTDGGERSRPA